MFRFSLKSIFRNVTSEKVEISLEFAKTRALEKLDLLKSAT